MTRRLLHAVDSRHRLAACLTALLVTAAVTFWFLRPISAFADDVSSKVTGITTEAESYDSYSTVKCTLSFTAEQLSSGDTITATWSPTSGTVYATGFSATYDVTLESDSSVVIGTAVVTESEGITITFGENVGSYTSLSGDVTFYLRVVNTGTTDGTVTISSGDASASITVSPKDESTITSIPVYKTGEWDTSDTNYIYWAFRVNRNYSNTYTSDVVITDTIPSGFDFDEITALNVYTSGDTVYEEAGDETSIDNLMNMLGIGAVYDSGTGTLTITIPQSIASTYYIYFEFTTKVSDWSSLDSTVTNTAIATYGTSTSDSASYGISETLTVPSSNGSADGNGKGDLSITKKVTGTAGNTSTHYTIQLSQSGLSGTYDVTYTGTEDDTSVHPSTITFTDGVATLQLKDGETATVSGVPTGTMAVSEIDLGSDTAELTVSVEDNELTVSDDGSTSVYLASISTGATTSVTITNNSELAPSTGISDGNNWKISLLVLLASGVVALLLIGHSIKGRGYARKE